ncbi:phage major capsid protein, partial [Steroidobacter sp.]|uniref:phage major capsid protein n=1 Tax=Steroidobacter sp. TaxID=1978227 RepID=UPI0025E82E29
LNTTPGANDDNGSPMRSASQIEYIPLVATASPITSSTQNLIDGAIDLAAQVNEGYLTETDRCAFVMHRLTAARIRKLKASTAGTYLWQDAANGNPATLAGYRVITCDAMSLSSTANAFPILFGNWRRGYLLADRTSMQITLDPYTTPGQTKFYARKRVGGTVKSNDAIKALKIAVS